MPSAVRVVVGLVIGLVGFFIGLAIDVLRGDGLSGLLLIIGSIVGGAYTRRAGWGLAAGFHAALIALFVWAVLNPGLARALTNLNILVALLLNVLIVAVLAGATGFIAGKIAGKRKQPSPT